jgi:hypothetical protein
MHSTLHWQIVNVKSRFPTRSSLQKNCSDPAGGFCSIIKENRFFSIRQLASGALVALTLSYCTNSQRSVWHINLRNNHSVLSTVIQCEVRLARLNKLIRCTPSAPSQKLRSGSSHEKARGREGVMTSNFQELILLPECAEREREESERERESLADYMLRQHLWRCWIFKISICLLPAFEMWQDLPDL